MLYNYFKIALRILWTNKGYTLINSIGLATGLSIFTLVVLYVNHEKSYDQWDGQLQQVFRTGISEQTDKGIEKFVSVQYPLGTHLAAECTEVALLTRVQVYGGERLIAYEENTIFNKRIIAADSSFFKVFPYKFVYGNALTSLNTTQTVVITRAISEKIFGKRNPLGKTLKFNNKDTYTVSGVIEKPGTSHLDFDICMANNSANFASNWFMKNQDTYVLLKPNSAVTSLQTKAQSLYLTYNTLIEKSKKPTVFFEPVNRIHLYSEGQNKYTSAKMPVYDFGNNNLPLTGMLLIGAAILLLSCINYTNMAIARAGKRAKESGLRKVVGASRRQLIVQFLVEAFIQSLIAGALALCFTIILKNIQNNAFALNLSLWSDINGQQNLQFVFQLMIILVAVTIIAGLYPAFLLSGYLPVKVLKGDIMKNVRGRKIQDGLLIFQYSIATCFIVSILIIGLQMRFMHSNNAGFNTKQTLRIQVRSDLPKLFPGQPGDRSEYVTSSLMKMPGVSAVSMSDSYPGQTNANIQEASFGIAKTDTLSMKFNFINFGYFDLLGMHITNGRGFSASHTTDSVNATVINQTAAKAMGWKNPLGRKIDIVGRQYTVIGVSNDSYFSGYGTKVPPEIYVIGVPPNNFYGHSNLLIKVDGNQAKDVLARLSTFWNTVDPGFPMRYTWLDQDFEKLMEKDIRFSKIAAFLTLTAVILAAMGILSLSAFTAEQRTKEIGIRKVLGASVQGIVGSFFTAFLKLVFIAILIALPIAGLVMNKWLQAFAYRIQIQWWMFLVGGAAALLIAILTISFQALKAAMANPVNSLRDE